MVDLKLEVVVVPVSDVTRPNASIRAWDGAWTPISRSTMASASSSSRHPARRARSSSARTSRRPHRARRRACISSSPRSKRRAPSSSPRVPRSARCFIPQRLARSSNGTGRAAASAARHPITRAIARSPRSPIQTATAGCSRRSRHGFLDADSATWMFRRSRSSCGKRKSAMPSTNGRRPSITGQPSTPPTSSPASADRRQRKPLVP